MSTPSRKRRIGSQELQKGARRLSVASCRMREKGSCHARFASNFADVRKRTSSWPRARDIPGLVAEAETVGGVMDAIKECAPHLIAANPGLEPDDGYAINVGYVSAATPAVSRSMSVEIPLVA